MSAGMGHVWQRVWQVSRDMAMQGTLKWTRILGCVWSTRSEGPYGTWMTVMKSACVGMCVRRRYPSAMHHAHGAIRSAIGERCEPGMKYLSRLEKSSEREERADRRHVV